MIRRAALNPQVSWLCVSSGSADCAVQAQLPAAHSQKFETCFSHGGATAIIQCSPCGSNPESLPEGFVLRATAQLPPSVPLFVFQLTVVDCCSEGRLAMVVSKDRRICFSRGGGVRLRM